MADLRKVPDLADEPTASTPAAAVAADAADERLIREGGLAAVPKVLWNRIRGGDLGTMPVIIGLIVICLVFYIQEPAFLSSRSLVTLTQFAAPTGVIALGIVLVLLLGEIDLSVGSVSGFSAAVTAVLLTSREQPMLLAFVAGVAVGAAIGLLYAALYRIVGVPSFVFSLAGLLAFQGALLTTLGSQGTITLPQDSWLRDFARNQYLSDAQAYGLVGIATVLYLVAQLVGRSRRRAAGLTPSSTALIVIRTVLLAAGLSFFCYYLGIARGVGYLFTLFVLLVVAMDLLLRKTRWGRHVMAVGGNEEAARRSGINVTWVYTSVFVGCSALAALGGLLMAGQLTTVSQSSGTTDTNLTAIAAAVIGGASLFGGRGTAYAALFGILVLQAISAGLDLMSVDSDVRYMVTGAVLLLAVGIDSVSRKLRSASGRG